MRNGFKIANPALKPEVLYNFEIGSDLMVFKTLHIAPSLYYSVGKDFIQFKSRFSRLCRMDAVVFSMAFFHHCQQSNRLSLYEWT